MGVNLNKGNSGVWKPNEMLCLSQHEEEGFNFMDRSCSLNRPDPRPTMP